MYVIYTLILFVQFRTIMADKEIKDIRQFVTKDGSSGFKAEKGRYHLYVQHGCPFAQRLVFMLLLLLISA